MRILNILEKDKILAELTSRTKKEVLEELAGPFLNDKLGISKEEILKVINEREKLGSTGIGEGIAIPHGKLKGLSKIKATFGRSLQGVDFDSMDGKPAYLFFMALAPENVVEEYLKILAKISRIMKDSFFREALMKAKNVNEIYEIIAVADERY
ncbi:MAG: PTS sugar transporter subunit IIA [bacterium]|nr:PTS sugar transporter subunit IIA [bacterium]